MRDFQFKTCYSKTMHRAIIKKLIKERFSLLFTNCNQGFWQQSNKSLDYLKYNKVCPYPATRRKQVLMFHMWCEVLKEVLCTAGRQLQRAAHPPLYRDSGNRPVFLLVIGHVRMCLLPVSMWIDATPALNGASVLRFRGAKTAANTYCYCSQHDLTILQVRRFLPPEPWRAHSVVRSADHFITHLAFTQSDTCFITFFTLKLCILNINPYHSTQRM